MKQQCEDQSYDGFSDREIAKKFDSSDINQPRVTVISAHNSKSYQIDGLTYDYQPDTYMFQQKDGSQASMSEYFFKRYNIKLNPKQPLLVVNYKSGDNVYLPTELCHEASLPKDFTKDVMKMRDLQKYKITSAEERKKKILKLISKFMDDEVFDQWNMTVTQ